MFLVLPFMPTHAVDLQWMIQVEENIPADIRVDRIYEEGGQIVVVGTTPRHIQVANYMRHIEARGIGVPQLEQATPVGTATAFTIRISNRASAP
jgi:hypothetical protein